MKPTALKIMLLGVVLALSSAAHSASKDVTLLVVPREEKPVRVGIDIGNRFPVMLLSYQLLPGGRLSLLGWNGSEWVVVSEESYRRGTFFPKMPKAAVIVLKRGQTMPAALLPSETWSDTVFRIDTAEQRPLIHLLGAHFGFAFKDWKWFSENYRLPFNSINPDGLNVAWYDRQLDDDLGRIDPAWTQDLQYYSAVRMPVVAVPPEPVAPEKPEVQKSPDATDVEPVTPPQEVDDEVDPFALEAPAATVTGSEEESADEVEENAEEDGANEKG